MALDTAYATLDDYRARQQTSVASPEEDAVLTEELAGASQLIDKELGVARGMMAPHSATYYFDSDGDSTLYLKDGTSLWYGLRAVDTDGIRPDLDQSGDYDNATYQWDLSAPWIWPLPRNHAAIHEPAWALELRHVGAVPFTTWPYADGGVRIAGDWGWEETPKPILELCVAVARQARDAHRAGGVGEIAILDDGTEIRSEVWRLWASVKREYSRGIPSVGGGGRGGR